MNDGMREKNFEDDIERWLCEHGGYAKGDPIMDYKFQDLPMSDWLLEHSWEYGIIFRFPVQNYPNRTVMDKSYKTGESKKLSIYRYVGQANAAAMHTLGFCMEEYIEYLMAHPHIGIYENGELRYEIIRQTIGANTGSVTVTFPSPSVILASPMPRGVA